MAKIPWNHLFLGEIFYSQRDSELKIRKNDSIKGM